MPRRKRFIPDHERATKEALRNRGRLVRSGFHEWLVASPRCVHSIKRRHAGRSCMWDLMTPDGRLVWRTFASLDYARSYAVTHMDQDYAYYQQTGGSLYGPQVR